ncbi:hypothetical protein XANCAGTX0491_004279 [Xanthoria calcicola]
MHRRHCPLFLYQANRATRPDLDTNQHRNLVHHRTKHRHRKRLPPHHGPCTTLPNDNRDPLDIVVHTFQELEH